MLCKDCKKRPRRYRKHWQVNTKNVCDGCGKKLFEIIDGKKYAVNRRV